MLKKCNSIGFIIIGNKTFKYRSQMEAIPEFPLRHVFMNPFEDQFHKYSIIIDAKKRFWMLDYEDTFANLEGAGWCFSFCLLGHLRWDILDIIKQRDSAYIFLDYYLIGKALGIYESAVS